MNLEIINVPDFITAVRKHCPDVDADVRVAAIEVPVQDENTQGLVGSIVVLSARASSFVIVCKVVVGKFTEEKMLKEERTKAIEAIKTLITRANLSFAEGMWSA